MNRNMNFRTYAGGCISKPNGSYFLFIAALDFLYSAIGFTNDISYLQVTFIHVFFHFIPFPITKLYDINRLLARNDRLYVEKYTNLITLACKRRRISEMIFLHFTFGIRKDHISRLKRIEQTLCFTYLDSILLV